MKIRCNRRRFLQSAGALAGIALLPRQSAAATAVVMETRVISAQPDSYHGWPTLARRKNGQLLVAYSGGREEHVCPFGRVELIRSGDDGRTWSEPQVVYDSAIDDRDAGLLETAKGTLLVTTFTSLDYEAVLAKAEKEAAGPKAWPAERLKRWQTTGRQASAEQRKALLGVWCLRSTDGGKTFSQPTACHVDSPHGPIQLADGRLLYPGKALWEKTPFVGAAQSTDDGVSWHRLSPIPTRPGDSPAAYHELHGVEAADGSIVVQIRNHNKTNSRETLQCESTDGGKSWSVPRAIGVWGLPTHLLRLADGRLLMTYGYRRPPYGNQARLSVDHGKSWSPPLTISADGAGYDLGYPSSVQLADGSLLTVWYEQLASSPRAVLRQAHWQIR